MFHLELSLMNSMYALDGSYHRIKFLKTLSLKKIVSGWTRQKSSPIWHPFMKLHFTKFHSIRVNLTIYIYIYCLFEDLKCVFYLQNKLSWKKLLSRWLKKVWITRKFGLKIFSEITFFFVSKKWIKEIKSALILQLLTVWVFGSIFEYMFNAS